jgi:hypothetical protein
MHDGIGQSGAGTSDNRLAGEDLQHNRQTRTADEAPGLKRMVRQPSDEGGPMKEHMDHKAKHLEEEKHRHEKAMEHQKHHMEKHHMRQHDSQHGHDDYKY